MPVGYKVLGFILREVLVVGCFLKFYYEVWGFFGFIGLVGFGGVFVFFIKWGFCGVCV